MIILDTNQLEYIQPPDGPLVAMLGTLATQTGHRLCLPEIALEEHLAHYRRDVEEADRVRRTAEAELRTLVPHLGVGVQPPVQLNQAVQQRTQLLQQVFQILQLPEGAAREALRREANRLAPAKVSWETPGTGARDVAIWLTAISASKEGAWDTYFVAQDNAAFGKSVLKPELQQELRSRGVASNFRYCNGVDKLLDELAVKHDSAPDRMAIARAEPVRKAVLEAMDDPGLLYEITFVAGLADGFATSRGAEQLSVTGKTGRIVAYRIGDMIWACASISWQATRPMSVAPAVLTPESVRRVAVTFKVRTTLVMQLAPDGTIEAAEVSGRGPAYDVQGRFAY